MTRRITLAIVAALAALLLSAGLAAAQDPPETATATRLEPGLNLVGWVGEPTPVSQLFQQIPQLEAIWAWDAELRDWIVAAPGAPEWLGGLGRVTAGMGLRMQLGGDEPFLWRRSTEPTRGLVKLRTGWNLVAWSGADGTAIGDVVKGIGWSLRTVRRWDPATQEWTVWTSPERSAQVIANTGADTEIPGVRRGEALWIEVVRAVNWLQPTNVLPRLAFPGGASQELQTRVREDLQTTLAFFRDQYGIQANTDFTIYVAKDVDALIQAYRDDGKEVDEAYEASERALWNSAGGWGGSSVVVKQTSWPEDLSSDEIAWARYTVTHEYFHVLQRQLRDSSRPTDWLVEGTASWVEDEHAVFDGQRTWDDFRDGIQSAITDDAPGLRSTESDNARWEYTLGWLATDQLTANTAPDFPIEFWRQLTSTKIGPHLRWTSTPDWRTAFQVVYGRPASEFYEVFNAWQREQAKANPSTVNSYDGNWIRGRVTGNDGAPVAGVFVNAIRVEGGTSVGWNQRAETDATGEFAVRAPQDGDYRISVDIADDCTLYYSDGELINERNEAQPIAVAGRDVHGIDVRLPPNVCGWQIRGRVVDPDAEPLAGISVTACSTSRGQCYWSTSAADGSFAVTVGKPDEYHIYADLSDGCSVYFRSAGTASTRNNASAITVAEAHVSGILIEAPEDLCRLRVAGSLDGIERFLDGYLSAQLCRLVDNRCESTTSRRLEGGGRFAVATPASGTHRLTYHLDGCSVYYGPTGLTANATGAALINVDSRDVRVGHRQIPANVCAHSISGALISAAGQPLADTYVSACLEEDGGCVAWIGHRTDDDGAFEIIVPADGRYRLSFSLEGCSIYFRAGGLTTTFNERSAVRVQGRDTRLNPRQIPDGMCAHRISGRFVDASGAPLSETWINVRWPGGAGGAWTDPDGRFEIPVPSDGGYYFSVQLQRQPQCWAFLDGQDFGSPNNPVRVSGADVTSVVLRLPSTIEELCE